MNSLWFLAAADDEGEIISSESVGSAPAAGGQEAVTTEDGSTTSAEGEAPPPKQTSPYSWLPLVAIFVIMYMLLFRGPKKKQQQHAKMVQSLQKNDKVRTAGGIFGTVVDIKDDEIILKVDESNNTKIKVASSAISKVLLSENR